MQVVLFEPCCSAVAHAKLWTGTSTTAFPAGEYSAERLKELRKNAAPRPSEPAGGVFKLSGSFKPAGAPAAEASFAAAAVVQVLVHFGPNLGQSEESGHLLGPWCASK